MDSPHAEGEDGRFLRSVLHLFLPYIIQRLAGFYVYRHLSHSCVLARVAGRTDGPIPLGNFDIALLVPRVLNRFPHSREN